MDCAPAVGHDYLKRAERAGVGWPLPGDVSDAELERRLFAPTGGETRRGLARPDWPAIHRELRRKGVTLSLVWEEYRAAHPKDGYGYSRFCDLYRRWERPLRRRHCSICSEPRGGARFCTRVQHDRSMAGKGSDPSKVPGRPVDRFQPLEVGSARKPAEVTGQPAL